MSIGLGIAIAGVWAVPVAALLGKTVSGQGVALSMLVAMVVTAGLVAFG